MSVLHARSVEGMDNVAARHVARPRPPVQDTLLILTLMPRLLIFSLFHYFINIDISLRHYFHYFFDIISLFSDY
jgi:hypothetical protein